MSSNEQLEQPLWELIYELLSPEEEAALLQRITSEPELARAYAKVKLQVELVSVAARCEDSRGALVRPDPEEVADPNDARETDLVATDASDPVAPDVSDPVAPASRWRAFRVANWIVAAAAMGLVVMSALSLTQLRRPAPREVAATGSNPPGASGSNPVRTVVTTPAVWKEDATNFISVRTAELDGTPAPTSFELKLYDAEGEVRLRDLYLTDESGAAQVELDGALAARSSRIEFVATNGVSPPLGIATNWVRSGHLTHLTTDLPTYQPGDTMAYRSLSLSRFDQRVDQEVSVEFDVLDELGTPVPGAHHVVTSQRGVGDGGVSIPPDATDGTLTVLARSPDGEFPEQRRQVQVRKTKVADDQHQEQLAKRIPIHTGRVDVQFFPEGGELAAGLLNHVYFQARDVQGQPVHLEGRIVDGAGNNVARAVTVHKGRGRFAITTRANAAYQLVVEKPAGAQQALPLPAVSTDAVVVLHADGRVLDPSDAVDVTLRMRGSDRSLVLAAACRGSLVGLQAIEQSDFTKAADGTSQCQRPLKLAPEASGVIRVTVYDAGNLPLTPVAERLIYRRPARRMHVRVDPIDSPRPGQRIKLGVQTTDEEGRPTAAALGVSVVNQAILNVAHDRSANLETYVFLTSEIRGADELEDANFFLGSSDEAATAMDLLLGTRGWRRFEEFGLDQVVQAAGRTTDLARTLAAPDAEYFAKIDPLADQLVPVVLDNRQAIENERMARPAPAERVSSQWIRSRESLLQSWGTVLLVGGLLVLIAVAGLAVTRSLGGRRVWVPSVVMAGMAAVLGVFWMGSRVTPLGDVAYSPVSMTVKQVADASTDNEHFDNEHLGIDATADALPAADAIRRQRADGLKESGKEDGRLGRVLAEGTAMKAEDSPSEESVRLQENAEGNGGGGFGVGGGAGHERPASAAQEKEDGGEIALSERVEKISPMVRQLQVPRPSATRTSKLGDKSQAPLPSAPSPASAGPAPEPAPAPASAPAPALVPEGAPEQAPSFSGAATTGNKKSASKTASAAERKVEMHGSERDENMKRDGTGRYYHRVYSDDFYKDVSGPEVPSVLLWQPLVITDATGRAIIEFELPSAAATYVLRVDAHGDGRLGSGQAMIDAREP